MMMIKKMLLAGAATALIGAPAYAQEIDGDLNFDNNIQTSVVTDVTYTKDVGLFGTVTVGGDIEVDSSAVAVSDTKQIINGNAVLFGEDNGNIVPVDGDVDGDVEAPAIGYNTTRAVDVAADGNVGVNMATGFYNSQANVGTIAVATTDSIDDDEGGWAEANTTSAQSLTGTFYGSFDDFGDDDDSQFLDRNQAEVGNIGGNGNIGVNAAAGAFNMQQNVMTLAVAADSSLAEATSGVVQHLAGNAAEVYNAQNIADAEAITGAGNIAVNVAAGVGNQQHNSLTVAASGAFGGNGTGGLGNGGF